MRAIEQKTPRAVVYTRVITGRQVEEGFSLGSQLAECKQKAADMGAVVIARHEDAGISGARCQGRPGMLAAHWQRHYNPVSTLTRNVLNS